MNTDSPEQYRYSSDTNKGSATCETINVSTNQIAKNPFKLSKQRTSMPKAFPCILKILVAPAFPLPWLLISKLFILPRIKLPFKDPSRYPKEVITINSNMLNFD
jgi:hypothetical protein